MALQANKNKRATLERSEKVSVLVARYLRAWKRKCLVFVSNNERKIGKSSKNDGSSMASSSGEQSMQQFCERHAKAAALDFSKATLSFTNRMPQTSYSHRDFMKLYVENFEKSFESDFLRRRQQKVRLIGRRWASSPGAGTALPTF